MIQGFSFVSNILAAPTGAAGFVVAAPGVWAGGMDLLRFGTEQAPSGGHVLGFWGPSGARLRPRGVMETRLSGPISGALVSPGEGNPGWYGFFPREEAVRLDMLATSGAGRAALAAGRPYYAWPLRG